MPPCEYSLSSCSSEETSERRGDEGFLQGDRNHEVESRRGTFFALQSIRWGTAFAGGTVEVLLEKLFYRELTAHAKEDVEKGNLTL